jgi:HlyD family secretion protein
MNTGMRFLFAVLVSSMIALSSAMAQGTAGLSEAEAAALEDQVNNVVREHGTLESAAAVELQSPIAGTIVFLVQEGTRVEKGDKLVELDATAIEEQIAIQRAKLSTCKAELVASRGELETRELGLQGVQSIGEKQVKVAEMKLALFGQEDGEYSTAKQDLADRLAVVEKQIAAATVAFDEAKANHQRGDGSMASVSKAEAMLWAARAELSVLQRAQKLHERKKQIRIAELELLVLEQKTNLNTTKNTARSEVQQAKALVEAAQLAEEIEQSRLDSLMRALEGAVIRAPQDGVILYPERRRGAEPLEAGATVRERQTILKVADLSKWLVAVTVNETKVGRVKIGQPAVIRVDALVNRTFQGKVTRINDAPEATTFLEDAGRQYRVIVSVSDPVPQLRVGMTAMVDIRTNQ